jgi:hypothetical protein
LCRSPLSDRYSASGSGDPSQLIELLAQFRDELTRMFRVVHWKYCRRGRRLSGRAAESNRTKRNIRQTEPIRMIPGYFNFHRRIPSSCIHLSLPCFVLLISLHTLFRRDLPLFLRSARSIFAAQDWLHAGEVDYAQRPFHLRAAELLDLSALIRSNTEKIQRSYSHKKQTNTSRDTFVVVVHPLSSCKSLSS